jgi:TonB family protein
MLVGTQQRKKRNSPKVNLLISGVFHGLILVGVLYFAARQGYMGSTMKTFAVDLVPKEKPVEKPKPVQPAKVIAPKIEESTKTPQIAHIEQPKVVVPSASSAPPAVAPPAAEAPTLDFSGGREVVSTSDPRQLYKELLQNALQLNWERPKGMDDHTNVAEVEIAVDRKGKITNTGFKKTSGQKEWDNSVLKAIASTGPIKAPLPTNFPDRVVVRFDVQSLEPVTQQ